MARQPESGGQSDHTPQAPWQFGEQFLDNLPAGVYKCDSAGLITYFNRQAVEIWGRAPKLNDPIDRFCGSFKLYATDGTPIAHDECWMALALRTDRPFIGEEIIIERPDGRRITGLAHASPIRDASGRLIGAVNVLIDISDRIHAEELRSLMAAIVDSSDDAIVSKSLDGTIRTWNSGAERLFGYSAAEAVGQHITLIVPPDRLDEEQVILARLRNGERIDHYETVRVAKCGRRIDISVTISPICDAAGKLVGASKVARDITVQKQAIEALADADRRKDEFLAMLAHELRNPLAPICNSLQLLRLTDDISPSVERVREILERQVGHLVRLVDDLLDISRITRGTVELRWTRAELAAIVTSAVETSKPLIEAAGHQLAVSLPREPISIEGDAVRLSQVFSNLLNNAAKYTEPGGQIWLTVQRERNQVAVSVKDTGLGIPAEMIPRVFDMFSQLDRTLTRAQGGLGIGLTLAKKVVEMHGGRIEAHSAGDGQGSEFVVYLPLASSRSDKRGAPVLSESRDLVASSRRILVVDDARDSVFILSRLLEVMGHQVTTTRDAATALKRLEIDQPDVLISDIAMPGIDGFELARCVRARPELNGVVLVALTGFGQDSDRNRSKEAGFDFHLTKPVGLDELRSVLQSLPTAASRLANYQSSGR